VPAATQGAQPQKPTAEGRDANGKFVKGNREGCGNPFARQVAHARQTILDCVTPEELKAVTLALLEKAKQGDVPAARVIFEYTIGKPSKAVDPDRLNQEEFRYFKDTARYLAETARMLEVPHAELSLDILRSTRVGFGKEARKYMVPRLLGQVPGYEMPTRSPLEALDKRAPSATAANGKLEACANGGSPSAAGSNGQSTGKSARATE
jgi:hypothetical protein